VPGSQNGNAPAGGAAPPAPTHRQPWHVLDVAAAARLLGADPSTGLSEREAGRRLAAHGPNRLREARPVPWWRVLAAQFESIVVLLLLAAALISFGLGECLEGASIVVVIFLNTAIGFFTEHRAARAMEALQTLGSAEAVVLRGGARRALPADRLVPGDVLVLQEGQSVPADARVLESAELQVNEAPLTGESVPVRKRAEPLDDAEAPLADRVNMAYRGTSVVSGNGQALVVGTGMATEIGRVSELVGEAEEVATPLEKRLAQMGRRLIVVCLFVAVLVAAAGIAQGVPVGLMLEAAIALAVAAVPEGLPAVATITLAVGMVRLARRNALIRRMAAVETLGSATCVCTDKTGTLTTGEMTLTRVRTWEREAEVTGVGYAPEGGFAESGRPLRADSDDALRMLLVAGALCNNATLGREGERWAVTGDPTEAALVVAAQKAGLPADALRREHEELKEFAFSSDRMMMGTVNDGLGADLRRGQGRALCVKGSPEAVFPLCTAVFAGGGPRRLGQEDRERLLDANQAMAADGLRVIALAFKPVDEVPATPEEAYAGLTWLGLAGIVDPPRPEVRETVDTLTRAGIKTVMITGDQPATAAAIAAELHIAPPDGPVLTGRELAALSAEELRERVERVEVFARVSPEQKVDVLQALRGRGEICAMLGDGVNDAVALKRADIGVAMGLRGTDVAKETADMLLLDDSFVTVAAAVRQGRIIRANISKFIHYMFSCNLSEICTMLVASLLGEPLPLLPLQILWLNIVTDVFPALALAMEPGEPGVMDRPPRPPDASLLDRKTVRSIGGYAGLITAATLAAFLFGRFVRGYRPEGGVDPAVTLSFLTIGFAQIFHVFNSRKERGPLRGREWLTNRFVLGAVALTLALQLAAVYAPGLRAVLKTSPPAAVDWVVILGCALMPLVVGQAMRRLRRPEEGRAAAGAAVA